jgi:hypothetical protein
LRISFFFCPITAPIDQLNDDPTGYKHFPLFFSLILLLSVTMANDLSSPALSENGTIEVSDVDKIQLKNTEPSTGSQFKEFIKTVIRFSGDLSSLTCPAFFLNGLSLLEYG